VTALKLDSLEDIDHFARVAVIARTIPDDVDLDDEADVCRALFLARFCAADFDCVLDDVIECARRNRATDDRIGSI
jgi:hypothetical protein